MSGSTTKTATQEWTIIPVGRETDSEGYHHYDESGCFVFEGAMTPAQVDELVGYLEAGKRYRPALLNILGVALKRFDTRWYDMDIQFVTILTDEDPADWLRKTWPSHGPDDPLNEYVKVTISEFLAAAKKAAALNWRMPRVLHIEIAEDIDGGWSNAAETLAALDADGIEHLTAELASNPQPKRSFLRRVELSDSQPKRISSHGRAWVVTGD